MKFKQFLGVLPLLLLLAGCAVNPPDVPQESDVPDSAPSTEAPVPSAPDTTTPAPVTDPPETNPPETEPPETEPPETEPPVIHVSEISLRIHDIVFRTGEAVPVASQILPADATDPSLLWISSDPAVAVVDETGTITAVGIGKCTVTAASVQNPDVTDSVTVEVADETSCVYIDGILIANKSYPLPQEYAPGMDQEAFSHLYTMMKDAKAEGLTLWVKSSYRSYYDQRYIYNGYVNRDGQEAADRYSARAGHSEHQSGLAFDMNELTYAFGESAEGIWMAENCHKYGFILRYPKEKEEITGYMYEPWHLRYIGVEKAAAVYESGLCLEEFLGITSVYGD